MPKVSKQPPAPSSTTVQGSGGGQNSGPSAPRPMRLKVLYSLDETLPNCLARAKDVAQVRVAHLDENTPIGFVDLKTCVLNIAYSSPEILHHQGFDYSVYAFDFSEPDTPLIGLGLLSWVLSLPSLNGSQPPSAESLTSAQANRLVTGRVQKSLLGLFAGDARETLEVRMRLCRVPALKQSDYVSHMNQLSSISKNMPQGMDVASYWTNSIIAGGGQAGPPPASMPPMQPPGGHYPGYPPPGQGLMGPGYGGYPAYQTPHPPNYPPPPPAQYGMHPQAPPSHMPPPPPVEAIPSPAPTTASASAPTPPPPPPPPPQASQYAPPAQIGNTVTEANDSCTDDQAPPAKKRKTTVKRSNSSVGPGRPRKNSTIQLGSEAGQIPTLTRTVSEPAKKPKKSAKSQHVPSPALSIAEPAKQQQQPTSKASPPSSHPTPAHQSTKLSPPSHPTPASQPSPDNNPTPVPTSPFVEANLQPPVDLTKDESIALTPVYSEHENTHTPDDASDTDSLFIGSSPPPTILEEPEEEEEEVPQAKDNSNQVTAPTQSDSPPAETADSTAPTKAEPSLQIEPSPPPIQEQEANPETDEMNASSNEATTNEATAIKTTEKPTAKEKRPYVKKRGRGRPSLNSDPVARSDQPASDAPASEGDPPKQATEMVKKKRGRIPGVRKNPEEKNPRAKYITKERIVRQMKAKIAAGQLPNHCEHCGAIETPTWRKAKVKKMDPETGEEKEVDVQLCNPCGLWEKNHGTMRPDKYWENPLNDQPKPTRKPRKKKKLQAIPSDPADLQQQGDRPRVLTRPLTPDPERSENPEWTKAINKSLRRIQSSPVIGTAGDPINLVTPISTRRVLFPSAKKTTVGLDGEEPQDKENLPPEEMDWEEEFAKVLREANESEEAPRPATPTPQPTAEFKTPVKFTPNVGALATGSPSPWRSSIFANFTPGQLLATPNKFLGTPSKFPSPASGEIMLELINEWTKSNDPNTSPRARENVNMTDDIFTDLDFGSLLTSDQPMPSSPPPLFAVYDEGRSGSSLWSDIIPTSPGPNLNTYSLEIPEGGKTLTVVPEDAALDLDTNLVVDFSDFVAQKPSATVPTLGTTVSEKANADSRNQMSGTEKSSSEDD